MGEGENPQMKFQKITKGKTKNFQKIVFRSMFVIKQKLFFKCCYTRYT